MTEGCPLVRAHTVNHLTSEAAAIASCATNAPTARRAIATRPGARARRLGCACTAAGA